jgi:transposase, IS30 family
MKSYTHFTLNERKYLDESLKNGESLRKIAKALGRSPSTISREVKRNWSKKKKHYHHWAAQIKYTERRKACHRKNNLLLNNELYSFALEKLLSFWSPEIIAGVWNLNHDEKISFSSIYRAIYAKEFPGIAPNTHLRRRGKPYSNQRKSYSHYFTSSIHDREEEADLRLRFGDYEGDTIYGSVGKGYLVTAVDRKSRYVVAATCKDKSIPSINAAFTEAFAKASVKIKPLTLTLDNGSEFAGFKDIEKELDLKVYFADVHSPWQRGSNENINDVFRFFFPRGYDFRNLTRDKLDVVLDLINNRPRKCLGFVSPVDFFTNVLHLA